MNRRSFLGLVAGGGVLGSVGYHETKIGAPQSRQTALKSAMRAGTYRENIHSIGGVEDWLDFKYSTSVHFVSATDNPTEFINKELTPMYTEGRTPIITWQPYFPKDEASPSDVEVKIANGRFDSQIRKWANALEEWVFESNPPRRFYIRPFAEMNGNWSPWSSLGENENPDEFIRAWNHVQAVFDRTTDLTRTEIQWIWNIVAQDFNSVPMEAYFPGSDSIDWVGIDGYNWGSEKPNTTWRTPPEVFDQMLSRVRDLTDAPLCIPEFGTTSKYAGTATPRKKATWISSMYEYAYENNIKFLCYFDIDKETDWGVYGSENAPELDTGVNAYLSYKRALQQSYVTGASDSNRGGIPDSAFTSN